MTRLSTKSPTAFRLPLAVLAAVVLCAVSSAAPAAARPLHHGGPARHNLHHASPPGYGHHHAYRRDFRYGPIHQGYGQAYLPPAGYYYYDHPWRVQVIAAPSGYPVRTYGYWGGGRMGCY